MEFVNHEENSFICNCPIHYTGDVCQYSAPVEFSTQYKGNGYVELNSSVISPSPISKDVLLAVLFSTTQPNGLLVWYGQNKGETFQGQDFVALALVDGFVEFAYRLNNQEEIIRNQHSRVNDGKRHIAIMKRSGNQGTLELDSIVVHGESRPSDKNESYLPGNLFIGGVPNISDFTGSRYAQNFNGCINIVESLNVGAINIRTNAVSGYNVLPCPDQKDEQVSTEPPAN